MDESSSADEYGVEDGGSCSSPYGSDWALTSFAGNDEVSLTSSAHPASIVDALLAEIYYDPYAGRGREGQEGLTGQAYFTECVAQSSAILGESQDVFQSPVVASTAYLESKDKTELEELIQEMKERIEHLSQKLVNCLKRRNRSQQRVETNCEILTATLQALSKKRPTDSQLRFTLYPHGEDEGYKQWLLAHQAIAAHPLGLPAAWRERVWLCIAEKELEDIRWEEVKRFAFNDKSNPDDNQLGIQIVKDLHRTGCSGFCGQDAARERAILKRVLLAYARWNKSVGYCQGFNILAAVILQVLHNNEEKALKLMIHLVDRLLPANYFTNNLSTLQGDMVAFRVILKQYLPRLWNHLHFLQEVGSEGDLGLEDSGVPGHEPPLTDVFSVQWFLTVFATCLPMDIVLQVWDALFLHGSEVLFRVGLAVWSLLEKRLMKAENPAEFYGLMSSLSQEMLAGTAFTSDALIQKMYKLAPFPFPGLEALRDKYMYNIHPHSMPPDEEDSPSYSEDDILTSQMGCFSGLTPIGGSSLPKPDFLRILGTAHPALLNTMTPEAPPSPSLGLSPPLTPTDQDLGELERVYQKSRHRQRHAMLFLAPMPLTRNVQRVKGHTLERQKHGPASGQAAGTEVQPAEAGAVQQQDAVAVTHPRSYLQTAKQTEEPDSSRSDRLWLSMHRTEQKRQHSERVTEMAQGTVMNDIISSNHSSVLEGTDVDFTEAVDSSPTIPRRHQRPLRRDLSTDSSGSTGHSIDSPATNSPPEESSTPAVAQLITTADDDVEAERALLLSCPDLLVSVPQQDLHFSQLAATPPHHLKVSAESVSSIAARLRETTPSKPMKPDLLTSMPLAIPKAADASVSTLADAVKREASLSSSRGSDEPAQEAVDAMPETSKVTWQPQTESLSRYSSDSTGDESTTSQRALTPRVHMRPASRDKTHAARQTQQRYRHRRLNNTHSTVHANMDSSGDSSSTVIGSDSDDSFEKFDLLKNNVKKKANSSKKNGQMASVWQNHVAQLRRIQEASVARHVTSPGCSLASQLSLEKGQQENRHVAPRTRQKLLQRSKLTEFRGAYGGSTSPEPLPLALSHVF